MSMMGLGLSIVAVWCVLDRLRLSRNILIHLSCALGRIQSLLRIGQPNSINSIKIMIRF